MGPRKTLTGHWSANRDALLLGTSVRLVLGEEMSDLSSSITAFMHLGGGKGIGVEAIELRPCQKMFPEDCIWEVVLGRPSVMRGVMIGGNDESYGFVWGMLWK